MWSKEQQREYNKKYYQEHKEGWNANQKKHCELTEEQRLKRLATSQRWKDRNKAQQNDYSKSYSTKWRQKNPEKWKEIQKRHYQNNKPRFVRNNARRRAQLLRATVKWANEQAIQQLYEEAARLTKETGIPHHIDHIIPLINKRVCGLHVENNLQILPGKENQSKSNTFIE